MARYIDVDNLAEMINARAEMLVKGNEAFFYIAKWLNKLPAADVVEVVRCKDCKWWQTMGCAFRTNCVKGLPCADDFCSHGERRESNDL